MMNKIAQFDHGRWQVVKVLAPMEEIVATPRGRYVGSAAEPNGSPLNRCLSALHPRPVGRQAEAAPRRKVALEAWAAPAWVPEVKHVDEKTCASGSN